MDEHIIRMGVIKAHIRKKRTRRGPRYSVSVVRLFRNGDTWKESRRFGPLYIPLVRLVLDRAHHWLLEQAALDDPSDNEPGE